MVEQDKLRYEKEMDEWKKTRPEVPKEPVPKKKPVARVGVGPESSDEDDDDDDSDDDSDDEEKSDDDDTD